MNYTNVKRILKFHIDNNISSLWTFDEEKKEFNYLYKRFDDKLKIYTPQQLIDKLNNKKNEREQE